MKIVVRKTPWLEQHLQVTLEPYFGSSGEGGQLSDAERKFMNSSLVAPNLTDAKSGSVDGGFVALVVGGSVDVDFCGRGVKDGNDYGMTMENTSEESEIIDTKYFRSVVFVGMVLHDGHEHPLEKHFLHPYGEYSKSLRI
ncbi:hypothetical protein Tco_0865927 [Tanacetum coccineum]